jgi:hypothetical protein
MKKKKKKQIQRRNFLKTHTKQSVFFNLPKTNLPKDKEIIIRQKTRDWGEKTSIIY